MADGSPDRAGEVRQQAGAYAMAVDGAEGFHWRVERLSDGLVRTTSKLAHTDHWKPAL
jgi:hypothetical protein